MTRELQLRLAGKSLLAAVIAIVAMAPGEARGALLNLTGGFPDIAVTDVSVSYTLNGSTGTFVAVGNAVSLDLSSAPGTNQTYTDATFRVQVELNSLGTPQSGYLEITRAGQTTPLLKASVVKAFGAAPGTNGGGDIFQMRFGGLTGTLAPQFNLYNSVGVNVNAGDLPFNGSFTSPFQRTFQPTGTANVFAEVPEPTSMLMWSAIAVGFAAARRRFSSRAKS